jgi:prevent-host-death family protein
VTRVTIHQAKTNLSKLLVAVQAGEEIVVCKGQQPVAKLVPLKEPSRKRPPVGVATSEPVKYSEDCFAPLTGKELEDWGLGAQGA